MTKIAVIFAGLSLLAGIPCSAAIITVDPNGSADYTTIQAAIDAAVNGDHVVISEGRYTGDGNRDIDFLGKAITVRSTNPEDPNVVAATIIDPNGTQSEPHRGFTFHNGEGPDSVLDGVTITNGYGPVETFYGASPYAGGAIFTKAGPTIRNCIIRQNRAEFGGGICSYDHDSNPIISNCTITDNFADSAGGGIGLEICPATISGCTIVGNSTGSVPWFYGYSGGGGIYTISYWDPVLIKDCTIIDNSADMAGGGVFFMKSVNVAMTNCTVKENSADYGGGISCIYAFGAEEDFIISNCLVAGNTALAKGGGICIGGDIALSGGGAGYSSDVTITQCTVTGNTASASGGGLCVDWSYGTNISNSIFWDNTSSPGSEMSFEGGTGRSPVTVTVSYSDVQGGYSGIYEGNYTVIGWGPGNIDSDPNFVADPRSDYYLNQTTAGQDSSSPCVDAGSDTAENLEMDKYTTRTDKVPDDGIVDMGFHYFENIADLNNDGKVNIIDLTIAGLQWLQTPANPSADIAPTPNGDNFVNGLDFAIIQQNWQWPEE